MLLVVLLVVVAGQGFPHTLARTLDALAYAFSRALHAFAYPFTGFLNPRPRASAQALHALTCSFANLLDTFSGAFSDLLDALPDAFTDLLHTFAHMLDGLADATGEVADDLWVVVDRFDQAHDDVLDGIQPDLNEGVNLHVLDQQTDVTQVGICTDAQFQQI